MSIRSLKASINSVNQHIRDIFLMTFVVIYVMSPVLVPLSFIALILVASLMPSLSILFLSILLIVVASPALAFICGMCWPTTCFDDENTSSLVTPVGDHLDNISIKTTRNTNTLLGPGTTNKNTNPKHHDRLFLSSDKQSIKKSLSMSDLKHFPKDTSSDSLVIGLRTCSF